MTCHSPSGKGPSGACWGRFKQNTINVNKAGELQAEAVKLMDRAGYK